VTRETVVLLNNRGEAIGIQDKAVVHTEATPLHLAFSLYLYDGVWTNTCCGHPAPGEQPEEAVRRRLPQELGVDVGDLTCVLPGFSYTATDASGIVENEICPVFVGRLHPDAQLLPNSDEVMDWAWTPWEQLVAAVTATPFVFSPWAVAQVRETPGHPLS
jgi:isopentenyl-diphosphate delta-isomerase type 1